MTKFLNKVLCIYRCPPILELTLRVLDAFLQSSRTYLAAHIAAEAAAPAGAAGGGGGQQGQSGVEREELRLALLAAQDSAAVQILLECCLPRKGVKVGEGIEKNISVLCHFNGTI